MMRADEGGAIDWWKAVASATTPKRTRARKLLEQCIAWPWKVDRVSTRCRSRVAVTVGRGHTGASSLAGAEAVVCSVVFVSLAGFWCVCFVVGATVARFEAADFCAISCASSSALIFFDSSLAASSASKDWL